MNKRLSSAAAKVVVCNDPNQIIAENERVQTRIRERAYEISISRGHAGREMEDWLTAESEVISVPPVELVEKAGAFFVRVPVAGADPNDVQVFTTSEELLIKAGSHRHEPDSALHMCEFSVAPLFRCLKFPASVDAKSLKVHSQDGVLTVTVKKARGSHGAGPLRTKRAASRTRKAKSR